MTSSGSTEISVNTSINATTVPVVGQYDSFQAGANTALIVAAIPAMLSNILFIATIRSSKHFGGDFYPLAQLLAVVDIFNGFCILLTAVFRLYVALGLYPSYTRAQCFGLNSIFYATYVWTSLLICTLGLDRMYAITARVTYYYLNKKKIAVIAGVATFLLQLAITSMFLIGQNYSVQPPLCTFQAMLASWQVTLINVVSLTMTFLTLTMYGIIRLILRRGNHRIGTTDEVKAQFQKQVTPGKTVSLILLSYSILVGIPSTAAVIAGFLRAPVQIRSLIGATNSMGPTVHSMVNLSIFAWKNKEFRKALRALVKKIFACELSYTKNSRKGIDSTALRNRGRY